MLGSNQLVLFIGRPKCDSNLVGSSNMPCARPYTHILYMYAWSCNK